MGKIIEITKYGKNKKGSRRRTINSPVRLGVTAVGFITVLIVCSLALLYLMQANKTATYGFEIEEYDNAISELKKEQDRLELEAARLRSTNQIKANLEKLNMMEVDPTKISYYEVDSQMAVKEKEKNDTSK
ncbi:MAG: hypothetical protein ABIC19_01825 [Patescibacteria group bacterium]|nr:hypothetical protein [Patescibacteria group bacterium]